MTKYHLSRSGTVAPCEASIKPCPLGGVHYDSKEEAQWEMMDLNAIRNHWRTGGMPGDFGWSCTCGWTPDDTTFSGLAKVNAHADAAHEAEVAEAKAAWDAVKLQDKKFAFRIFDRASRSYLPGNFLDKDQAEAAMTSDQWGSYNAHGVPRYVVEQTKMEEPIAVSKSEELPFAASSEAWSTLRRSPRFQQDLELAAMAGYRSYDASTVDESIDLARSELIDKYSKVQNGLGQRDAEVLLAHGALVSEQLRPLVKQLYLVGYFESDADKQAQADEEEKRARSRASYLETARIRRAAGL